jgi:RNA 3'-terminal phosphate cyclase (ATP)
LADSDVLKIDGSFGEGGGQILRTGLALSLVTGRAVHFDNVRAGRRRAGLLNQHLTAVRAAASIGRAEVDGAALGSRSLTFRPREVTPGEYRFSVGTAGSVSLVLQAVLPALLCARGPSQLVLEGGTHTLSAPPFSFLEKTFLPLINEHGPQVTAVLERHGFYPAGGGRIHVDVQPAERLSRLDVNDRGDIVRLRATAIISKLPRHIAERELDRLRSEESLPIDDFDVELVTDSPGPGNLVTIEICCTHITEVIAAFGQKGVRAEAVGAQAAAEASRYLAAGVPVGEHLADQLLIPMALAGGGSFRALPLSQHALTNIEVIRKFLDVDCRVETESDDVCRVDFGSE